MRKPREGHRHRRPQLCMLCCMYPGKAGYTEERDYTSTLIFIRFDTLQYHYQ